MDHEGSYLSLPKVSESSERGSFVDKRVHSAGHDCLPDEPPSKPPQNHWLIAFVGPPAVLLPDNQRILSRLQSIPYSFADVYLLASFRWPGTSMSAFDSLLFVYTPVKCTLSGLPSDTTDDNSWVLSCGVYHLSPAFWSGWITVLVTPCPMHLDQD